MSKTTQTETKKTATAKRAEIGPVMSGSEILVACLEREGVDTIFVSRVRLMLKSSQTVTNRSAQDRAANDRKMLRCTG